MTKQQRSEYENALARAEKAGLHIAGRGTLKATGETFYAVTSVTEAVRWHVVIIRGAQLVCDCLGAQHGKYCQHRAVVRQALEREAALAQSATDSVNELREATVRLAAQNAEYAAAARARETAPLYRSNAGFSMWASA